MIFNSSAVAFGRNETFSLRYNWIFKGLSALKANKDIFTSPDALNILGVGKNMMLSMRYWLLAYQLVEKQNPSTFTNLASYLFDPDEGKDPYLEDINTLWLLHWKLCTNPDHATMYFWFFNVFAKTSFTKLELNAALEDWLKFHNSKSISPKTLDRDLNMLLKTYSGINVLDKSFEDQLENPFHELSIVSKNTDGTYGCYVRERENLSLHVLGFCIAEIQDYFNQDDLIDASRDFSMIPVSEIMNSNEFPSIQKIFKTTEDCLYLILEQLVAAYPALFDLTETAGQKNLYIKDKLNPIQFLDDYFNAGS
jgi:hypothetical protein